MVSPFFLPFLPFLLTLNHLWGNGRAIWLLSIYFTAASENYGLHRLLSNSMAKGCLTVPFARLCGGWLQKKGIPGAGGYYVGIGSVSILIALWQTFEIYEYITQKDKNEWTILFFKFLSTLICSNSFFLQTFFHNYKKQIIKKTQISLSDLSLRRKGYFQKKKKRKRKNFFGGIWNKRR